MSMQHVTYLLAYPASFCETPEEARDNIWRMIKAEIPGWDGGPRIWRERLEFQLAIPNRTRKLNRHGAQFSAQQWVWLMQALHADCEREIRAQAQSQLEARAHAQDEANDHDEDSAPRIGSALSRRPFPLSV